MQATPWTRASALMSGCGAAAVSAASSMVRMVAPGFCSLQLAIRAHDFHDSRAGKE
jgi:hypothetical protein